MRRSGSSSATTNEALRQCEVFKHDLASVQVGQREDREGHEADHYNEQDGSDVVIAAVGAHMPMLVAQARVLG